MEKLLPGWTEHGRELDAAVDASVDRVIAAAKAKLSEALSAERRQELVRHWQSLRPPADDASVMGETRAVAYDEARIDPDGQRSYWQDTHRDRNDLGGVSDRGEKPLRRSRPVRQIL